MILECNDGFHEDPLVVGKLPVYIDDECDGMLDDCLLNAVVENGLLFLLLFSKMVGEHLVNADGRERMARQGTDMALKRMLVGGILWFRMIKV